MTTASPTDRELRCAHCGSVLHKQPNEINRALKAGANLYCNRACAGLARRRKVELTPEEKKAAKSAYDARRRQLLGDRLRAEKRAHYQANREAIEARQKVYRKKHMARHVAYCQRPEYRQYKSRYDSKRRAIQAVGEEFADTFLLLQDVEKEIDSRATRYEIYQQNGTLNKAQTRRRSL